jgi:monoamine oxidase
LNNTNINDDGSTVVLLNSPVQYVRVFDQYSGKIIQLPNDDGMDAVIKATKDVRVEVETHDGRTYTAKAAIITGAPPVVSKISFTPELPKDQRRLLEQQMPMGRSMKFAAIYNRGPWWRQHGLQGDILASGLPKELSIPGGEEPLFGYCFDLSPFSRKVGVLSCFLEGSSYNYFASLSKDRQQELMREFLRLTFEDLIQEEDDEIICNDDKRPLWEPDSFVVGDWGPDNPFVGGAYTSYFPPGVLSDPISWKTYRQQEKLPNVFLAGADYHAGFGNGYVEGAVRSGQQAADLILQRILVENSR